MFWYILLKSYTFLYVPCNSIYILLPFSGMHSFRHLARCPHKALAMQFLYVPYTFLYVPFRRITLGFVCGPPAPPRPTPVRSYTFCATVSISCCNHVLKLYVPIRSVQPSRNYVKRLYVPIRSYYVPIRSSICFSIFCWKVIRSYTFRATLSLFCEIGIRSYTFLLRSYTFFHMFLNILLKRYTFLYVPCDSVANTRNVPDFCPQSTF